MYYMCLQRSKWLWWLTLQGKCSETQWYMKDCSDSVRCSMLPKKKKTDQRMNSRGLATQRVQPLGADILSLKLLNHSPQFQLHVRAVLVRDVDPKGRS